MQTESLTAAVHNSVPEMDAARVSQCTLIALDAIAEHLDAEAGEYIANGLPDEAARAIRSGARRSDTTGQFIKLGPFIDKVRTRTELPPEHAEALTYAVAITVAHMLDAERVKKLGQALPKELDRLFQD